MWKKIVLLLWIQWSVWMIAATGQRVAVFQTDYTLWQDAVQQAPFKSRPWISYAYSREIQQQYPEALTAYQYAEFLTHRRVDQYGDISGYAHAGIIRMLLALGRTEEADRYLQTVPVGPRKTSIMSLSMAALQHAKGQCRPVPDAENWGMWECRNVH